MAQITSMLCSHSSGGSLLVFRSLRPELGNRVWKLVVTSGQTYVRPISRVCKGKGKGKTSPAVGRCLTESNMNPNVVKMQYAVRGPLVIRTGEIEKEISKVITITAYLF